LGSDKGIVFEDFLLNLESINYNNCGDCYWNSRGLERNIPWSAQDIVGFEVLIC
jgi:hypothetical protein